MTLGEWLTAEVERRGWSVALLQAKLGLSWARTKRLLDDEPKRQDGSPPQRRREVCENIANALNVPLADVLRIAQGEVSSTRDSDVARGYASETSLYDPSLDESDYETKRERIFAEIKCAQDRVNYLVDYMISLEKRHSKK